MKQKVLTYFVFSCLVSIVFRGVCVAGTEKLPSVRNIQTQAGKSTKVSENFKIEEGNAVLRPEIEKTQKKDLGGKEKMGVGDGKESAVLQSEIEKTGKKDFAEKVGEKK